MIRAIIIDDEPRAIQSLLWELASFKSEIAVIDSFTEPEEAIEFLKENKIDACFLDIEMPTMDGFSFLERIGNHDFSVIITSAYDEYALKALKEEAHDYLLKPISNRHLRETIDKIKKQKSLNINSNFFEKMLLDFNDNLLHKRLSFNINGCLIFVDANKIVYAEAEGNYAVIYTDDNEKLILTQKLKEVEAMLNTKHFYRIHNSYIVNLSKIRKYIRNEGLVIMENNKEIPVSRSKKNDFISQF